MMKIKAAILDLDGTLADTLPGLCHAMNEMLVHFGYPERSTAEITSFICYGQREFVRLSLPEALHSDASEIDRCQAYYSACYHECCISLCSIYDGLAEALSELKQAGIRLSVVTNKSKVHAEGIIKEHFPEGTFDIVIGHVKGLPEKPDPTGAFAAARVMGVDCRECLFIGDSDVDIRTGINAGMMSVGVSWGYRSSETLTNAGADYIVDNANELKKLVLRLAL